MRLNGRVSKLETKRGGAGNSEHPSIILMNTTWRTDDGEILSVPRAAHIRSSIGWFTVQRELGESGKSFERRIEQLGINQRR